MKIGNDGRLCLSQATDIQTTKEPTAVTLHEKHIRNHSFVRLHRLQALYCDGKIAKGSPQHLEILALEDLESLFVKQQMERLSQVVEPSFPDRTKQAAVP